MKISWIIYLFLICAGLVLHIRMVDPVYQMSGYCSYAVYSMYYAGGLFFSIRMEHVLKQEGILSGSQAHELYCCDLFLNTFCTQNIRKNLSSKSHVCRRPHFDNVFFRWLIKTNLMICLLRFQKTVIDGVNQTICKGYWLKSHSASAGVKKKKKKWGEDLDVEQFKVSFKQSCMSWKRNKSEIFQSLHYF